MASRLFTKLRSTLSRLGACAICGSLVLAMLELRAAEPVAIGLSNDEMAQLRVLGWRLLIPFTDRSQGPPNPSLWFRSDDVFFRASALPVAKSNRIGIRQTVELEKASFADEPPTYEMTFFNDVARSFIRSQFLYLSETTTILEEQLVREIQFPRGSKASKTFWYVIKRGQSLDIKGWQWSASHLADPSKPELDPSGLVGLCVADTENNQKGKDGCIPVNGNFYSIRVTDPKDFPCVERCPSLEPGDLLILVGLHVISKEARMPDWLWATFWWYGSTAPTGDSWTCRDAQRGGASETMRPPWSNYAMDVTASLWMQKPRLNDNDPCGAPGRISGGQELMATYNPFVEARMQHGLKSSCIECHSRASTDSRRFIQVRPVTDTGGPSLRCFEGQIRLDYLWSLWPRLRHIDGMHGDHACD